jgi:CheY-like chemotaxis protein
MNLEPNFNINQQKNSGQPLVLAVDDNEDNLQLLTQLLELIDCSFITAAGGETAILKAKNYQPNLILLDMMLPDISGVEVIYSLKQDPQTMEIPIIAVTAMARAEDRERFILAGCVDCVTKPYLVDELETMICKYVF